MFPIKDSVRPRYFPIFTYLLVMANVLVFLYEWTLTRDGLWGFYMRYALIPQALLELEPVFFLRLLSSQFIHANWFHLLGNMWYLLVFGRNVEDRMGSFAYLCFYLLSGIMAGLAHALVYPYSPIPTIGASGAIAGVLGAYLMLYPKARVKGCILIIIIPLILNIPVVFYLGFWFLSNVYSGYRSLNAIGAGGVAWWAHIGGFVWGFVMARLFLFRAPPQPEGDFRIRRAHPDEYPWE